MAYIDDLQAELENDPSGLVYRNVDSSFKPVDVIRDLMLNTMSNVRIDVTVTDGKGYMFTRKKTGVQIPCWWTMKDLYATERVAEIAFDVLDSGLTEIDIDDAAYVEMFTGLRDLGVLDNTMLSELQALADRTMSHGEAVLGRVPNELEIQLAIAEINNP